MDAFLQAVEKSVGAEWALVIGAVSAFFVVVLQFVRQTKEYEQSPRVKRCVGWFQLLGSLGASTAAIFLLWFAAVTSNGGSVTGKNVWVPFTPLAVTFVALIVLWGLYWKDRKESRLTSTESQSDVDA